MTGAHPGYVRSMPTPESLYAALLSVHDAVDQATAILEGRNTLRCGVGCATCCVDDLTVFEVEAERIRRNHPGILRADAHPPGACAFLDDAGSCRIYPDRPYVCRTQGLPLRWLEQTVERRDICPLNDDPVHPVETLSADNCWTLGPVEGALRQIQGLLDGGELRRIPLRSLFPPRGA